MIDYLSFAWSEDLQLQAIDSKAIYICFLCPWEETKVLFFQAIIILLLQLGWKN